MKKILISLSLIIFLTSCSNDETGSIPDDAVIATCTVGLDTWKYIYKDEVVYEFYSNDEFQNDDMLNIVQDSVDAAGTARDYLDNTFADGVCTFTEYEQVYRSN